MKTSLRYLLSVLLLLLFLGADAQRQVRYQRRKARVEKKIHEADREGKLSQEEKDDIARKEKRMNRTNKKALRNGDITTHEQNKMNRRLRKVKRETRRDGRN